MTGRKVSLKHFENPNVVVFFVILLISNKEEIDYNIDFQFLKHRHTTHLYLSQKTISSIKAEGFLNL